MKVLALVTAPPIVSRIDPIAAPILPTSPTTKPTDLKPANAPTTDQITDSLDARTPTRLASCTTIGMITGTMAARACASAFTI